MEKLLPVLIVVLILLVIVFWTQKGTSNSKGKTSRASSKKPFTLESLKSEVQSEFGRFSIKERNGQIMICEIDHRGQFEELVFIKLIGSKPKSIELKGRFLVATYPYIPSRAEMRKDFGQVLNKY